MKHTHIHCKSIILLFISAFFLSSCATTSDLNKKFAAIDRVWLLDYQQDEEKYRFRVVDAPYIQAYGQIQKTFVDLGLPVIRKNYDLGEVYAEANAPTPLSQEEWLKVRDKETPRVREVGGWLMYLAEDPSDYILTVRASIRPVGNKTIVVIDYALRMPEYEAMGLTPSKVAPPEAVRIGSDKFWAALDSNLAKVKIPKSERGNKSKLETKADELSDQVYDSLKISQQLDKTHSDKRKFWKDSVVTVILEKGFGSGFFITEDLIITNQHVVGENQSVIIQLADGKKIPAKVLRKNQKRDVALVRVTTKNNKYFKLNKSLPDQGDDVFVIGSPSGSSSETGIEHASTMTSGIVSAIRNQDGLVVIQSDVNVRPGNSGGPMLNNKGEVIGITSSGIAEETGNGILVTTGINYFIPSSDALSFLSIDL